MQHKAHILLLPTKLRPSTPTDLPTSNLVFPSVNWFLKGEPMEALDVLTQGLSGRLAGCSMLLALTTMNLLVLMLLLLQVCFKQVLAKLLGFPMSMHTMAKDPPSILQDRWNGSNTS